SSPASSAASRDASTPSSTSGRSGTRVRGVNPSPTMATLSFLLALGTARLPSPPGLLPHEERLRGLLTLRTQPRLPPRTKLRQHDLLIDRFEGDLNGHSDVDIVEISAPDIRRDADRVALGFDRVDLCHYVRLVEAGDHQAMVDDEGVNRPLAAHRLPTQVRGAGAAVQTRFARRMLVLAALPAALERELVAACRLPVGAREVVGLRDGADAAPFQL